MDEGGEKISQYNRIGVANGLGVYGTGIGQLLEVEVHAREVEEKGNGKLTLTGFVQEEEIDRGNIKLKKESTAKGSIKNVLTILNNISQEQPMNYDIHINVPGGIPVDGPSAGTAILCAVYSAIHKKIIPSDVAMTGEVSIIGNVLPVGGVQEKINAAMEAGITKVFIPQANYKESYRNCDINVIPVSAVKEIINHLFYTAEEVVVEKISTQKNEVLTASQLKI